MVPPNSEMYDRSPQMVVFSYRLKLPLNYFVLATLFLKYIFKGTIFKLPFNSPFVWLPLRSDCTLLIAAAGL